MVGIALDVDDVAPRVLAVAARVDDHAAGHRAVRADGARLGGAGDLEGLRLRVGRGQVEAERRGERAGGRDEATARNVDHAFPQSSAQSRVPSAKTSPAPPGGRGGIPWLLALGSWLLAL